MDVVDVAFLIVVTKEATMDLLVPLVGSGEYFVIASVTLAGRPERCLYSVLRPLGASRFSGIGSRL
jgi:hypothetical protein